MKKTVGVKEWTSMLREIGLKRAEMDRWHKVFEARHPDGHQSFLEWLGLTPRRIERIRASSQ
ncbi:MAG: hypothetical protein IT581_16175 [Verrucomicrobiales bacterium]|nr:hypothetical protein [Verrucomicrobiales bacterium]